MGGLPPELLQLIAKDVEHDPSIFSLRLVSKAVNSAATPLAFRVVVVNDTLKSAKSVSFVQECDDSITSLVQKVIFRGDLEQAQEEGGEVLRTVFSKLIKFTKLKSLWLQFHSCFEEDSEEPEEPEDYSRYFRLQQDIFRTLAASPPQLSLISLRLSNLLSIPDDIYIDANFRRIFEPLHSLDISTLSQDPDGRSDHYDGLLVQFWNLSMPAIVRSAVGLSTLTIRSDQPVGTYPAMPFKDTVFPRLSSLALHNFAIQPSSPDADVAAFIVRHKRTLTRLELHGCSIDGGEDGIFPRPWHAVLELLEKELDILREFEFEERTAPEGKKELQRDPRFWYTGADLGWGYTLWDAELETESLDLPALESLQAAVKSRHD
ncbi:hypothetical protein C8R45DRAFT_987161 [Mycena sanguinolenta]|nr:hypothetical protein C8R45DRAFT_987161 [Mycena sanguinolenta]